MKAEGELDRSGFRGALGDAIHAVRRDHNDIYAGPPVTAKSLFGRPHRFFGLALSLIGEQ
jgi:hypothetical protein